MNDTPLLKYTVGNKEPLQLQALGFGAKKQKRNDPVDFTKTRTTLSHVPLCSLDPLGGVTGKAHAQAGSGRWTLIRNKLSAFRSILPRKVLQDVCFPRRQWKYCSSYALVVPECFELIDWHRYQQNLHHTPKKYLSEYKTFTWCRMIGQQENGRVLPDWFLSSDCCETVSGGEVSSRNEKVRPDAPGICSWTLNSETWRLELKLHCDSTLNLFLGAYFLSEPGEFYEFYIEGSSAMHFNHFHVIPHPLKDWGRRSGNVPMLEVHLVALGYK